VRSITNGTGAHRAQSQTVEGFQMVDAPTESTPTGYGPPSQSSGTSSGQSAASASPTPSPTTPLGSASEAPSTPLHPGNSRIPDVIPYTWYQQAVMNMNKFTNEQRSQLEIVYTTLRRNNTAQQTMELMQREVHEDQDVDAIFQFCLVKAYAE